MKVLNYGSLNLDYVYEVDHFVKAGETLASRSLAKYCGGKGLNQSIALRKCGVEVWHAGAVGESDSDMLLEELVRAGVNTDLIQKKPGNSGHTIIQTEPNGLLNEIEAQMICKETGTGKELIEKIAIMFPKAQIVLTLGTEGSIYKNAERMLYQSAYKVKAVDTTAAGDTYTGYFIGSLIKGETIENALMYAAKASAIAVTRHGAGPSIPTMEEVLRFSPEK